MPIELSPLTTIIISIIFPIFCILLTIIIYLVKKNQHTQARYISQPIILQNLISIRSRSNTSKSELRKAVGNEFFKRTVLIYMVLAFFLICNLFGEIYQVVIDRVLLNIFVRIIDGVPPPSNIWINTVIESPFSTGFRGTQLWYGMYPNPIYSSDYFHRSWEWIFYTSALFNTHFPYMQYEFFGQPVNLLVISYPTFIILMMLIIGSIFLLFLLWKNIHSFNSPILFFEAGLLLGTKGIFSCFAMAWQIEVNGKILQYGAYLISRVDIAAQWVLLGFAPVIIGFFFLFLWIGKKVWKKYYSETNSISKRVFLISTGIVYFTSLLILLV